MAGVYKNARSARPLAPYAPFPASNPAPVAQLLGMCSAAAETPLADAARLADGAGLGALWIKDERGRMGLGSFKALGAAYVIAHEAAERDPSPGPATLGSRTYVTASAGNHGMSVTAGAAIFGARAVIYIADTVPEAFARRLAAKGAEVRREGADYAASMAAAQTAAQENGWTLLSDSSWEGYTDLPHRLMEGYLQLAAEAAAQVPHVPSHIFLQAGVGGMAAALAAHFRDVWGDAPVIIVVEPDAAPALLESVRAGRVLMTDGPVSSMGRLDCKEPSAIALNGLARDADWFVTLTDAEVEARLPDLAAAGLETTASGGAGVAAALSPRLQGPLGLGRASHVLCILSEGPE
ncbi:MAG: pyridoxal-phosphate dependent enzyme [Rhodobacteraceae bacterium]|nr:pyridoxal-phosphate dependent enzyme [Paracoccaceae bacterium]